MRLCELEDVDWKWEKVRRRGWKEPGLEVTFSGMHQGQKYGLVLVMEWTPEAEDVVSCLADGFHAEVKGL